MPRTANKSPAVLTITGAATMHPNQRNAIIKWLTDQAKSLMLDHHNYAPIYRARYVGGSKK